MPLQKWNKVDEKTLAENPFWTYKLDNFKTESGKIGEYHYLHTLGSTLIIPVTVDNKIILVNQFRYLNQKESLEFPCGSITSGFSIEENAIKELREETGFSSEKLNKIAEFSPFTGASDELCTVFIAKNLIPSPLAPDHFEEFEILEYSPSEIDSLIQTNQIFDGMTLAAWLLAKPFFN